LSSTAEQASIHWQREAERGRERERKRERARERERERERESGWILENKSENNFIGGRNRNKLKRRTNGLSAF
jgi:hypothetical protein